MRKKVLVTVFVLFFSILSYSQAKIEVLYFKADLTCCKAAACNTLEGDIKAMVEENYKSSEVVFKEVKISDAANAELVKTYDAKSQTVVIVKYKKSKVQKSENISQEVKQYAFDKNKDAFKKTLLAKIDGII